MPSSKGKPTDPKKREEARKEVLNMEKGGGKGNWSAYKAAEMAKKYEAKGGGYEDTGDNANEAKTGAPKPKKEAVEKGERKDPSAPVGTPKTKKASNDNKDDSKTSGAKRKADEDKPKEAAQPKKKTSKTQAKPPAKGTRTQPKRGAKKE
ncbi:predicted ABC-type transport, ATPase component [Moesziomyces antarcticus T-34]|uniref:Predicted ABC-type transport, ATPase component n=1 Tax=Pseudozyma antarctica (strain T-34) TaxID=1151754 RepID=M9LS08_PSEA3|nr:predicted ABC-type transport, ATPase component [Moesziomyces antarcticus T-34]